MRNLTPDEIEKINIETREQSDKDFSNFKKALAKGLCSICGNSLNSFDENMPCQHWLLMPPGFRKKHLKKLFEVKSIDKIEGFLRWYVNCHVPIRNINDLKGEHDGDMVKALTIKHDNLEWSFSISKGCFDGVHGIHGPHYHFQMRVDGRPFHDYSDRHIKLSDYEKWLINVELGNHPQIKRMERHGAGMQDMYDNVDPEILLNSMKPADEPDNATYHVSSVIVAEPGKTISSDDVADMLEERKRTGVPIHQLVKRLKNAKARVIVEPGPGVPIPAQRTKTRRRKNGKK